MAGSTVSAGTALQFGGPAVSAGGETSPSPSFEDVSHADLDALLHHYVDGDGQVCYSKWQDHQCDVQRLGGYIVSLTFVDPSLPSSQEATMSYHINAYNALAIWGILREYPVASIQRIDGKRTSFAIFDDLQLWVGDQCTTLGVALAAGPYRVWSKISPKLDPLKEKLTGSADSEEICGCACGEMYERKSESQPQQFSDPEGDRQLFLPGEHAVHGHVN